MCVYPYIQLTPDLQFTEEWQEEGGADHFHLFFILLGYRYILLYPTYWTEITVFVACLASQVFFLPVVNNIELVLEIWIDPIFLCDPPTFFCLLLFVRAAYILALLFLLCISYLVTPFTSLHSYGSSVFVQFSC